MPILFRPVFFKANLSPAYRAVRSRQLIEPFYVGLRSKVARERQSVIKSKLIRRRVHMLHTAYTYYAVNTARYALKKNLKYRIEDIPDNDHRLPNLQSSVLTPLVTLENEYALLAQKLRKLETRLTKPDNNPIHHMTGADIFTWFSTSKEPLPDLKSFLSLYANEGWSKEDLRTLYKYISSWSSLKQQQQQLKASHPYLASIDTSSYRQLKCLGITHDDTDAYLGYSSKALSRVFDQAR